QVRADRRRHHESELAAALPRDPHGHDQLAALLAAVRAIVRSVHRALGHQGVHGRGRARSAPVREALRAAPRSLWLRRGRASALANKSSFESARVGWQMRRSAAPPATTLRSWETRSIVHSSDDPYDKPARPAVVASQCDWRHAFPVATPKTQNPTAWRSRSSR